MIASSEHLMVLGFITVMLGRWYNQ